MKISYINDFKKLNISNLLNKRKLIQYKDIIEI